MGQRRKNDSGLDLSGKTSLRRKGLSIKFINTFPVQSQIFDRYIYGHMNSVRKILIHWMGFFKRREEKGQYKQRK